MFNFYVYVVVKNVVIILSCNGLYLIILLLWYCEGLLQWMGNIYDDYSYRSTEVNANCYLLGYTGATSCSRAGLVKLKFIYNNYNLSKV